MRGPYKVLRVLLHRRYELAHLTGSYGQRHKPPQHMVLWRNELTPETCEALFANSGECTQYKDKF